MTALVSTAGLALLGVVLWVSTTSPTPVVTTPTLGPRHPPAPAPATMAATPQPTIATGPPRQEHDLWQPPEWLAPLISTAILLVLVLAVLALVAHLGKALVGLSPTVLVAEETPVPTPVPEELVRDADRRHRLIRTGPADDAVIACWLSLEEGAAAAGLPRDPAQTSDEYTREVLSTWDVDDQAIDTLAELYREARFSGHSISEDQRNRARTCLERIDADLTRAVRAPHPPTAEMS